jgi:hypothetical protein
MMMKIVNGMFDSVITEDYQQIETEGNKCPLHMQESDGGRGGRLVKLGKSGLPFATLTFNKVAALTNIFFFESNLSKKWNQQESNPGF